MLVDQMDSSPHGTEMWGEQTALAVRNFPISGEQMPRWIIEVIAMIKAEAAQVNGDLGVVPSTIGLAVQRAANEIVAGKMSDQFPVDVFQTGSGTSTNMNVNEVVAHRASDLCGVDVHPNDHVNASQSSNDVFPSAIRIAAAGLLVSGLQPALVSLAASLRDLSEKHRTTVTLGRTHLMDAVPITFGQEAGGWARGIELGSERLMSVLPRLGEVPLGGTAVGTGLNAPADFGDRIVARLAARTGLNLTVAKDRFEAQSSQDVLVELSGALKTVALTLYKIAGDLRLLSSGPDGGFAEIRLPALQAGSSIMPGKVNPVLPEVVQQVAAQVVGNDATITFAATMSTLQLNTAMPVMARSLMSSLTLLTTATAQLDIGCIRGIEVDEKRMRHLAERSSALVTVLAPRIGYEAAAELVKEARATGRGVAETARSNNIHGLDDLDVSALAHPW